MKKGAFYKTRSTIFSMFKYFLLITLAILMIYPLYFALISSFKPSFEYIKDVLSFPNSFFTGNYSTVLIQMNMLRFLWNTVFTVSIAMFFYLTICSAAGLAFGKFQFKGKIFLFSLILFFQIFPQMVVAQELYLLLARMRLLNTNVGLIIAWCAYFSPFGAYIMTTYFATVPKEIIESARMDGTGVITLLFKIMIPVAKPMLGTIGVIGTLSMWNELPFAMLIMMDNTRRTVTAGITMMQGEFGVPVTILSAAVIISAIIPTICYFIFQRFIAMSATAGTLSAQ